MSELKAIMLKELSAVREDVVEQPNSRAENQMNVGFATRDRNLFVTVRFRFTTEPAAYSVSATFNLQYVLSADPDPKDAEVFAQTNAVFNAWPFWRELVQNTAIRLGFPAPTVPLLKI